ncbi:D-amino acid dehydrogenase small subunit, partial [Burkholderia pseudomallei]
RFGIELARVLRERLRVAIHHEPPVDTLRTEGATIDAARTPRGEIAADAFVLSAGNGSAPLLRRLGMRLPIYPMTGYSLT